MGEVLGFNAHDAAMLARMEPGMDKLGVEFLQAVRGGFVEGAKIAFWRIQSRAVAMGAIPPEIEDWTKTANAAESRGGFTKDDVMNAGYVSSGPVGEALEEALPIAREEDDVHDHGCCTIPNMAEISGLDDAVYEHIMGDYGLNDLGSKFHKAVAADDFESAHGLLYEIKIRVQEAVKKSASLEWTYSLEAKGWIHS